MPPKPRASRAKKGPSAGAAQAFMQRTSPRLAMPISSSSAATPSSSIKTDFVDDPNSLSKSEFVDEPNSLGESASMAEPDITSKAKTTVAKPARKAAKWSRKSNNFIKRRKPVDPIDKFMGMNETLKPIYKITDIFADMTDKALHLGLEDFLQQLGQRKLKVATMCSGTESPVLALQLISEVLPEFVHLDIQHMFSAEIVPFKQAYIERNFNPPVIFRDVREFSLFDATEATTVYGSKALIPGDLDLLIAGFACVDFSKLNNHRLTLDDGGESGDTFRGIKDYANKYRPKVIILENICGAPWGQIRDEVMPEIGYRAKWVKVDTKNYYIPHTRNRGYLIAVDTRGKSSDATELIVADWCKLVREFERPASSPVEYFLLPDDDPRLTRARSDLANRENSRTKVVSWTVCKGRHQKVRTDQSLGLGHPLTKWREGGSCQAPDYSWHEFYRCQVERILDLIDISFLRSINRGFDLQFKSRYINVSQNVDRDKDAARSGLVSCITPTGHTISTTRGGPIIGLEALSLQGLPIDKLHLTREKQQQLQDLAGNAMTSTVVGAAILAALIACKDHFLTDINPLYEVENRIPVKDIECCGEQDLVPLCIGPSFSKPLSVADATAMAIKTVRLCFCEGRTEITSTPLRRCRHCKHTTCTKCGRNPIHKYALISEGESGARLEPREFESIIKESIPMRLRLFGLQYNDIVESIGTDLRNQVKPGDWDIIKNKVLLKVLGSELRFHSMVRSEIWTVKYESEYARIEFVIASAGLEWRLFAKPLATEPVNSRVRELLSKPIARMIPLGDDITKGTWQFWLPTEYKLGISITGLGHMVPSYENTLGIGKFASTNVWSQIHVEVPEKASRLLEADISGIYKLRQDCGTAFGSLHVRDETLDFPQPLFLYLDSDHFDKPKHDSFIFSTDKKRLNFGDYRPSITRVDSCWRPEKIEASEEDQDGSDKRIKLAGMKTPPTVDCYVDGQWVNLPKAHLISSNDDDLAIHRAHSAQSVAASATSCNVAYVIVHCQAKSPDSKLLKLQRNEWRKVPFTDYNEFLASVAWMKARISGLSGFNEWSDPIRAVFHRCQTCAPRPADITWKRIGKKIVSYENHEQANSLERSMKNRASPLVILARVNDSNIAEFKILANHTALMHRAAAKLIALDSLEKVTMSWHLATQYFVPTRASFEDFILEPNKERTWPAGLQWPPGFRRPLRPEQQRSLRWMIQQETDAKAFIEEEIEESFIPQLGWRAEGRAVRDVIVKGGVLADEVGYGKTVTTLALIASQRERDFDDAKLPVDGRISIKATLILVPSQLPNQWLNETKDFLRPEANYNVLVIKTLKNLQAATINDFICADIIIVSHTLFNNNGYLANLAQFAGKSQLIEKGINRQIAEWYKKILHSVGRRVNSLKGLKVEADESSETKTSDDEGNVEDAPTVAPSKRQRGKQYQKAKSAAAAGSKRKRADSKSAPAARSKRQCSKIIPIKEKVSIADSSFEAIFAGKMDFIDMKCPPLELFEFSRIVVDEFTYLDGLTISNLKARSRWILSATPPLKDFADVKGIAKFLGINLGIDVISPGVIKPANIKALEKDKTNYELFESFKQDLSLAWHENRHQHAQKFLNHFVRSNVAVIDEIKCARHMMAVELPAAERAMYVELNQNLVASNFEIKKGRQDVKTDRVRRIEGFLQNSDTAGEALIRCASHFILDNFSDEHHNSVSACDSIVELRNLQYQDVKEKLMQAISRAELLKLQPGAETQQYETWKKEVENHHFADSDCKQEISEMISEAVEAAKRNSLDGRNISLRNFVRKLRELSTQLVSRYRSNRFVTNVRKFQEHYGREDLTEFVDKVFTCDKCDDSHLSPGLQFVLPECGHVICAACVESLSSTDEDCSENEDCSDDEDGTDEEFAPTKCPVDGCTAEITSNEVVQAQEFAVAETGSPMGQYHGKKIEDVVRLIQKIPKDDQVLLFVQFTDLMETIASALGHVNVRCSRLDEGNDPTIVLEDFQKNQNKSSMKKVLILNMGNASAAGSNLTCANHVIFLSPFMSDDSAEYKQALKQAEGRARRFGQKKTVHVYQFVTLKTIEVDVLELRSKKILSRGVVPPQDIPYDTFQRSDFVLVEGVEGQGRFGTGHCWKEALGITS